MPFTTVAAWLSLLLSAALVVNEVGRRLSASRRADPAAWLERHNNGTYCVIANRGPADAVDVTIEFRSQSGEPLELDGADQWPLPLKSLVAGDSVYLNYIHIPMKNPWVLRVHLTWRDKRPGRQKIERTTSLRPVVTTAPLTPRQMREQAFWNS